MAPASARSSAGSSGISTPVRFDPKALLNPKSFKASRDIKAKEPANSYASTSNASLLGTPTNHNFSETTSGGGGESPNGQASLIERMHRVERREERPVKRQKKSQAGDSDDEDLVTQAKKSTTGPIASSGVMGEYLKEQRREALEKQGPPIHRETVDLTASNEDDDDDLIVISDSSQQEVCLGKIENARVSAHKVPQPRPGGAFTGNKSHWPPMKCTLHRRPGPNNIIAVSDPMEHDFANLDARTAAALVPIMDGSHVTKLRTQARLDGRPKKPFDYPGQQVSDNYSITINLYAPRKFVIGIGKFLSQKQVFLREPLAVDHGVPIVNPHAPRDHTPAQKAVLARTSNISSGQIVVRTQEEARKDVMGIFDNLQDTKDLPGVEAPPQVLTPLLDHQKQAVYFMRKRELLPTDADESIAAETSSAQESGSFWKENIKADGRKTWLNVITGHEVRQKPVPALGGILADVMGLGKTLNVLSLIVGSIEEAKAWAKGSPSAEEQELNPAVEMNSKATLLLCPLSTIVNWQEQIKAHLKPGSIRYTIYQGSNRTNDPYKLRQNDLVISTYATIAAEINSNRKSRSRTNSPVFEINWFRVVLDEAHIIRKQTTVQCKAACTLSASRRWCLSGTPVQNRLDDLGALIKFLRVKPFDKTGAFQSFITTPLRTGDSDAIPKLRLLVDTITLRRLKDKVSLPPRHELIVKLAFSDTERKLYDFFATDTYKNLEAMAGQKKALGGKSYAHVLRAIGRLRMLCVHGSDMLSSDDWDKVKGWDPSNAIDIEDEDDQRPDRPLAQVFEMYRMMKDANVNFCAKCNTYIVLSDGTGAPEDREEEEEETGEVGDEILGYLTPCNHLICPDCIDNFRELMTTRAAVDNYANCQICDTYIRVTFNPIKQSELIEDERAQEELRKSHFAKNLNRYMGPSTKVEALLNDLALNDALSAQHPDERPIKSVVFSEWVTLLDLMQLAFTAKNIKFTRLDGKMTFSKRQQAIEAFTNSSEITVILVSLHAGGLGLNLTAASRVYTMEPNYNPAAEAQAVERVHRLGQTREVVIKRFVMEKSIEEKVLKLQEKKVALAEFSVERGDAKKMNKMDAAKQKLEDLKELLR